MSKVSIIGTGTWGIALALVLVQNQHEVTAWSALPEEIGELSRTRRCRNLPAVTIPGEIRFTTDLREACTGKDMIVLSVPSVYTRGVARQMRPFIGDGPLIVSVAKGVEEGTLMTVSRQIEEEIPAADVAVLSGPSHAEEVSIGIPTTVVAGSARKETALRVQDFFMNHYFRVYVNPDVLGIELGGALKNVIALAAGASDGLGCGDNTKAALMTRGITEMTRLGIAMGAKAETFAGLSGIGDLIVTCTSMHSRNRRAGILIGQGKSMQEAMDEVKMVVEGVYSAKAGLALSEKYHVQMPIVRAMNEVLFNGKPARAAMEELMSREKTSESALLLWE